MSVSLWWAMPRMRLLPRDTPVVAGCASRAPQWRCCLKGHRARASTGVLRAAATLVLGARLLVVDDSEANRRFAAFIARKLGCADTGDGDEVVAAVSAATTAAAPFDIVLMDLVIVRSACASSVALRIFKYHKLQC